MEGTSNESGTCMLTNVLYAPPKLILFRCSSIHILGMRAEFVSMGWSEEFLKMSENS